MPYDAKSDVRSQFFTKLTTLLNIFAALVWCSGGGGTEECTEVAQEQDNQDKWHKVVEISSVFVSEKN